MIRAAAILLALLCAGCTQTRDDSDPPTGGVSGFNVYVDHGTGCQYIGRGFGGITPRIAEDGLTHRGCRKTERTSP